MQPTSVTKTYTVSKLTFIGPRDTVYYQFSAHKSEKRPRLSAKAKQAKYLFIKSDIVCSTESRTLAVAMFHELYSAHRMDRLCINISRRCILQDSVEQSQAFNDSPTTQAIRARKFTQTTRDAQKAKVQERKATPWLSARVKGSETQTFMWSKADEIYDHWLTVDGAGYGSGYRAINTLFYIRWGFYVDTIVMLQHFKSGWNPHEDLHWQTYYH